MTWKNVVKSCFFLLASVMMLSGCHSSMTKKNVRLCDSLCDLSYKWSYRDKDSALDYVRKAQVYAAGNPESEAQCLNNLAFVQFLNMNFVKSRSCYLKAASLSNNILYQLISEIGLMRIYQLTSENAGFYMFRNNAQRHIERIREEIDELNVHERDLFQRALQDYHIISATYFLNLRQTKRALSEMNAIIPDDELLKSDTIQWLAVNELRNSFELVSGKNYLDRKLNTFDAFMRGLRISRSCGYTYFTTSYLQGLSVLMNRPDVLGYIRCERHIAFQILTEDGSIPIDSLSLSLAGSSLQNAGEYGNFYLKSVSWCILAGCYFRRSEYKTALTALCQALEQVNAHYRTYYKTIPTPHFLQPFNPSDAVSVEKKWMDNPAVLTVPEWIARIREQLSMVYSALDEKVKSDYNRNVYLDILEITRQDKETEIRYRELRKESQFLNILLTLVLLTIIGGLFILFYFKRKWSRSHRLQLRQLRRTLEVCRHIIADQPDEVDGEDELFEVLSSSFNKNSEGFFCPLEIRRTDAGGIVVKPMRKLSKDETMMVDVISCFMNWAFQQGKNMILLGERQESIKERRRMLERKIFDDKKENEVRRACVSLVNNVTPLIDRMLYELSGLQKEYADEEHDRKRFQYIYELTDKINEYNRLLTDWIQIRRGLFNLHIETFCVQDLFTIIEQRKKQFERAGKRLVVSPATFEVKADRLLTLFMINTLVENAFKFTNPADTVRVYASAEDDSVEISVRDSGIGLSREDCDRILNSKVYDSSLIGASSNDPDALSGKRKGEGFGLMNCKGIIEKYRKSDSLFHVCMFGIESEPGKGSRFFFRLPRVMGGVLTLFLLPLLMCFSFMACDKGAVGQSSEIIWKPDDIRLHRASSFADSVYYCNISSHYDSALNYADSAFHCLNAYYKEKYPHGHDTLCLYSESGPVELKWFVMNFNTDYHVILDLRNESAVSALALQRWHLYRYNNTAYTSLFKLLGEDHLLSDYCRKMQRSSNNKVVLIGIILLLAVAFAIAYYLLYFRRKSLFLIDMKQVLMMNRNLVDSIPNGRGDLKGVLDRLRHGMEDIIPVKGISLAVYDENTRKLVYYQTGSHNGKNIQQMLRETYEAGKSTDTFTFPLVVEWSATHLCVGAWHIDADKENTGEAMELLSTLMSRSLANYVYHTVVKPERKKRNLELAEDEIRRAHYEASILYVQNRVLDNCLSTIKHETMYYPSRIRQLAGAILAAMPAHRPVHERVVEMYELALYYKKIYTLLSLNAERQLSRSVFKCADVRIDNLFSSIHSEFERMEKKHPEKLSLLVTPVTMTAKGDALLLYFLLRNLLQAALSHPAGGQLTLSAQRQEGYVRVCLTDNRLYFNHVDFPLLFSPEGCGLKAGDGVEVGTEFLICKQIIRDHAEYTSDRGCRMLAEALEGGGFSVWFTIPESYKNK